MLYSDAIRVKIRTFAQQDRYKFKMYLQMNPNLEVSPFINNFHPLSKQIIRFRLGSHCLPIETGRWGRITRENRLCVDCGVLGDELHALYHCTNIDRSDINLPDNLDQVWESPDLFKLFQRLQERNCLD